MLALNAAVEAARDGEAGAGFAVVADEVRNLPMRAADAAKNTADLIEGTIKKIKDGSDLVTETNASFAEVAERSSKVGELVAEISAASNEQAQGINQVNHTVSEMDKLTQQNAANAEESASASEEMNTQANYMKTFVKHLVALVGRGETGLAVNKGLKTPGPKTSGFAGNKMIKKFDVERAALNHRSLDAGSASPEQAIPLDDDFKHF